MRIIAGKARSLHLKAPKGPATRPTTDRIKETLFNMIQTQLPDSVFLDLFAGSGGIGLEAVSRGSAQAVFVENDKKAADCIKDNIEFTKFTEKCTLFHMDVLSALHRMEGRYQFDLVFMDPPYENTMLYREVLYYFANSQLIHENTLLIVEIPLHMDLAFIEDLGYQITKEKKYKTNAHIFLSK
ncbi:16S rRNA (guanine(966)-N(2))-methyltransferase RsmD [Lachnospiraceae bacterium ZAX-1]